MITKTLPVFISEVGDECAAEMFQIEPRTARAYRLGERMPRRKTARLIIESTKNHPHGPITYEGIYNAG